MALPAMKQKNRSRNSTISSESAWVYEHYPDHLFFEGKVMLHYAIVFLIIALVAGLLGFFGIAGIAAEIAKVLFVIFLILFVLSLVFGRRR